MSKLIGTDANQVPSNADLGSAAYIDKRDLVLAREAELYGGTGEIGVQQVDVFVYNTANDSDGGAWRHRTQHTSWYNEELNTRRRGSRKEFPSVVILTLNVGNVSIYDADVPHCPLWMRWNDGNLFANDPGAICMMNGLMVVGINHTSVGYAQNNLVTANFIDDTITRSTVQAGYGGRFNNGIVYREGLNNQSDWNSTGTSSNGNAFTLNDYDINDVAITVTPNAKISPTTGLPIPTIAVATQNGVSVIPNAETNIVYDLTQNHGGMSTAQTVEFDSETHAVLWSSDYAGSMAGYKVNVNRIPTADFATGNDDESTWEFQDHNRIIQLGGNQGQSPHLGGGLISGPSGSYRIKRFISAGGNGRYAISTGRTLDILKEEDSIQTSRIVHIGSTYNTGWQLGRNKIATLCETKSGLIGRGGNLISGGNFNTSSDLTSHWSGDMGSASVSSNQLVVSGTGQQVYQSFNTIPGETYTAHIKLSTGSDSSYISTTSGTGQQVVNTLQQVKQWVATTDTYYIILRVGSGTATFDTVTVYAGARNPGVLEKGPQVIGNLERDRVAEDAELCAYSGFTQGNYLYFPDRLDLDHDWSAAWTLMFWFKNSGSFHSSNPDVQTTNTGYNGTNFQFTTASNTSGVRGYGFWTDFTHSDHVDDHWHLATVTHSGGSIKLYHDGIHYATQASTPNNFSGTGHMMAGATMYNGGGPYARAEDETMALLRLGKYVASPRQIKEMYLDEHKMFMPGAKVTLNGTSDDVLALGYDKRKELLHAGTSGGRSTFQGLVRVDEHDNGLAHKISASNGVIAEE